MSSTIHKSDKKRELKLLFIVVSLGIAVRVTVTFLFGFLNAPEMWEFGIIARNLLSGNGFEYTAITRSVPSAYMPPGLPYIYYFFFLLFGDNWTGYLVIITLNIIISVCSIAFLYKLGNEIYGQPIGLYSAIYASFSPVYIYSTLAFNSIVYYHLLIALCFYCFLHSLQKKTIDNRISSAGNYAILLGISLGFFLYFRAEMLVLTLIVVVIFLSQRKVKHAVLILFIPLVFISPWTVRNYAVFGKIIPIVTSTGYNFYTGHGDDASTVEYNTVISAFEEDSTFELRKSEFSYQIAFKYMKEKPLVDIFESLRRVFDLWIFDRYRDNAKNFVYLLTWFVTLLLFVVGYFRSIKIQTISSKLLFMKILILFATLLVFVFFNIPRYQLQISIVVIPTAMFALHGFLSRMKSNKIVSII